MKLTKNLNFLKPFLVGLRLVQVSKVSVIRGYRVTTGLNEQQRASIIKYNNNKYCINLKIQNLIDRGTDYKYPTIEQILIDLAHELAHLKEWEHTPKHFKLQAKIMLHFSKVLKELNIMDHSTRVNRIRRLNESN
jgi:hypothetical protein